MNKSEIKAKKIRQHLESHPNDYQSVVSLFKTESDAISYEIKKKENQHKKEISKYMKASD